MKDISSSRHGCPVQAAVLILKYALWNRQCSPPRTETCVASPDPLVGSRSYRFRDMAMIVREGSCVTTMLPR
jgi:hypothetical protein